MDNGLSAVKKFVYAAPLIGLLLLPFGGVFAEKNPAKKMKKEVKRMEVKIKKEPAKKGGNTVGKKKRVTNTVKKKKEPKKENRMSSEMIKKAPVKIKGDELLKLREQGGAKKNDALLKKGEIKIEKQQLPDESSVEKKTQEASYAGAVLAGTAAKLLDFTKTDYETAIKSDALVALYFYANWCPICKAEFPKMQEAFNELQSGDVVGFRVNYNDNETDDTERALAKEFGVAYQHTKVFLKKGERVLKSPEGWDKEKYVKEITEALVK